MKNKILVNCTFINPSILRNRAFGNINANTLKIRVSRPGVLNRTLWLDVDKFILNDSKDAFRLIASLDKQTENLLTNEIPQNWILLVYDSKSGNLKSWFALAFHKYTTDYLTENEIKELENNTNFLVAAYYCLEKRRRTF